MKISIFALLITLSTCLLARQPAVLPGKTLSTAKYNKNLPKADTFKGYKFTSTPKKTTTPINENLNRISKAGPQSISIYLTIFALLFPFGLWLINNKSLKDENEIINQEISEDRLTNDNVIELGFNSNEENVEQSEEDKDHKKAS